MSYRTSLMYTLSHTNPTLVTTTNRTTSLCRNVGQAWVSINGSETLSDLSFEVEGTYYSAIVHRVTSPGVYRVSGLTDSNLEMIVKRTLSLRYWLANNAAGGVTGPIPLVVRRGIERLTWLGVRYLTLSWEDCDRDTKFVFLTPPLWADYRLEPLALEPEIGDYMNVKTALEVARRRGLDPHFEVPAYAASINPAEGTDWATLQIARYHEDALCARLGGSRWRVHSIGNEGTIQFRLRAPSRGGMPHDLEHPEYRLLGGDGGFIAVLDHSPIAYRL